MTTHPTRLRRSVLVFATLLACVTGTSAAHGRGDDAHPHDHDRARQALRRGEVRPIAEILARVARQVPGEVLEVEFERRGHHGTEGWIYEIKVLADDGRVQEVKVDAASGAILEMEDD